MVTMPHSLKDRHRTSSLSVLDAQIGVTDDRTIFKLYHEHVLVSRAAAESMARGKNLRRDDVKLPL